MAISLFHIGVLYKLLTPALSSWTQRSLGIRRRTSKGTVWVQRISVSGESTSAICCSDALCHCSSEGRACCCTTRRGETDLSCASCLSLRWSSERTWIGSFIGSFLPVSSPGKREEEEADAPPTC